MSLKSVAAGLAAELKATAEYAELKAAKLAIDRVPALKSEAQELKNRHTALYSGRLSAREAESRAAELEKEFKRLAAKPEYDRYIKASAKFNQMVNELFKQINESLETGLR